jgi:hypothetical protein
VASCGRGATCRWVGQSHGKGQVWGKGCEVSSRKGFVTKFLGHLGLTSVVAECLKCSGMITVTLWKKGCAADTSSFV